LQDLQFAQITLAKQKLLEAGAGGDWSVSKPWCIRTLRNEDDYQQLTDTSFWAFSYC
jgi:hypothetical protein